MRSKTFEIVEVVRLVYSLTYLKHLPFGALGKYHDVTFGLLIINAKYLISSYFIYFVFYLKCHIYPNCSC